MLVFSSSELVEGDYTMYLVSEVTGDKNGNIYTNITDYKDAVQLQYTSSMVRGMHGGMGEGNRPNMELPADGNGPWNKGEKFEGDMITGEASTVFRYTKENHTFSGISTVEKE